MSSDGSVMSSVSQIRQFGLYRTIDARTEEFLRASRKRQMRQGCACAAISTAITVTVVVVILLIYEYKIAVEWKLVQSKQQTDAVRDAPYAERLDRSYFGFDQDYFEQMPLLVNSLQENNYFDPTLEMTRPLNKTRKMNETVTNANTKKPKSYTYDYVRKTTPRPFFYEHKSTTPLPFSKTYGTRSWIESYRNEERLKNIRQIIKYLEKTINAKVDDKHTKPRQSHIAFTGVYIEPMIENKDSDTSKTSAYLQKTSQNLDKFQYNDIQDPFFRFKPENPGDVNLLADDFLRFSPMTTPSLTKLSSTFTVSRSQPFNFRNCFRNKCDKNNGDTQNQNIYKKNNEIIPTDAPPISTEKSFSVMLNLYPLIPTISPEYKKEETTTNTPINKIYLTTMRPKIQFKRKTIPFRRIYPVHKRPRFIPLQKLVTEKPKNSNDNQNDLYTKTTTETLQGTQMIFHVKVYKDEKNNTTNKTDTAVPVVYITPTNPYTTKAPIEISTSQIEDHNVGSSGYLPVQVKITTPIESNFVTTTGKTFKPIYQDIVKFNHEDAIVPVQYIIQNRNKQRYAETYKRNSGKTTIDREFSTLIIKLRNELKTTTNIPSTDASTEYKDIYEMTTTQTYVPQINGHYRTIKQRDDKSLIENLETIRKKRIEMAVSGLGTYVPMYTVIKRNSAKESTEDD